jgi:hypothetical protein
MEPKRSITAALLAAAICPAMPVAADGFLGQPAVADATLDQLRGGFVGDDGLRIAIGIERLVHINGELVSSTMLNIPDLASLQARGATLEGPLHGLVQNGPGNFVDPSLLGSNGPGMLTVIQNSLDHQVIVGTTRIDLTLSGMRAMRLSDTLSGLNVQLHSAFK